MCLAISAYPGIKWTQRWNRVKGMVQGLTALGLSNDAHMLFCGLWLDTLIIHVHFGRHEMLICGITIFALISIELTAWKNRNMPSLMKPEKLSWGDALSRMLPNSLEKSSNFSVRLSSLIRHEALAKPARFVLMLLPDYYVIGIWANNYAFSSISRLQWQHHMSLNCWLSCFSWLQMLVENTRDPNMRCFDKGIRPFLLKMSNQSSVHTQMWSGQQSPEQRLPVAQWLVKIGHVSW